MPKKAESPDSVFGSLSQAELVAELYSGEPEQFERISNPGNKNWVKEIQEVPIAGDKVPDRIDETDVTFYKKGDQIIHILQVKECTIISFIEDEIVEGSVILTQNQEGIEVEYGKNSNAQKGNMGEYMLSIVINNYYTFSLPNEVGRLYGKVVPLKGEFNFGSYITLLRSGFVPISRQDGDGIKFIRPGLGVQEEHPILDAYNEYEEARKEYQKAIRASIDLKIQHVAVNVLSNLQPEHYESDKGEEAIRSALEKKRLKAESFKTVCLSYHPQQQKKPRISEADEKQPDATSVSEESSISSKKMEEEETFPFADLDW